MQRTRDIAISKIAVTLAAILMLASIATAVPVPPGLQGGDPLTEETQPASAVEETGRSAPNDPGETDNRAGESSPDDADAISKAVEGKSLTEIDWIALLKSIWTAKLFKAGDNEISLSQIVIALLVVVVGLLLARRVVRLVSRRVGKAARLGTGVQAVIEKILYYLAVVVIVLIAMPIAGIPITIFTLLGGALAIGIGFGAQNLFNNLISGLIIMIERPIRLGDIVEVEDTLGKVEDIGNRCTRVRRVDGVDVLIPNSSFLENAVVNWTLQDKLVRGKVSVGVAYGSDLEKVKQILNEAAVDHDLVLNDPPASVLFLEFGDNALAFELWFWMRVSRPLELVTVESDLRFFVDRRCREEKISIAFPQRDLHLDTLTPLEVRVIGQK